MSDKKQLVPQLRFPEFEETWHKEKLGKRSLKIGDGLHGTPNYVENSNIYFVNGNNINSGKIEINQNTKQVSEKEYKKNLKGLNQNTILISINGTIGNIGWYNDEKVMLGKSLGYLIFSQKPKFEFHYLNSDKAQNFFASQITGTTIKNLSLKTLRETNIIIPKSNKEQQKIADFLSSMDTHIQTLEKKKAALELYKKGVTQKIFQQDIRFKDDDGKEFPEWEKCKLSKLCDRVTQKNKIDNQNVLTISAQMGLVNQLEYFNRSVSSKNLKGYYLLKKNDFAYNKSYSNGYPMGAIKRLKYYEKGVVSTLYICFRFKETVSFEFMEQYFDSGLQNKEIKKVAQEGARNHGLLNIGVNDFFDIRLSLPSIEEQTKIAEFLSSVDKQIQGITQQIEQIKTYKKGLLQQMFV